MFRGKSKQFKVVKNDRGEYAVWHADAGQSAKWDETGWVGSVEECRQFVESRRFTGETLFASLAAKTNR